jgi:pimeloyl-ACP methyl ester carboxylesterase
MARKSGVTGTDTIEDRILQDQRPPGARRYRPFFLFAVAAAGVLLLALTTCRLVKLKRDLGQMSTYGVLGGSVGNLPGAGTSTYILILTGSPTNPTLVEWERVRENGVYFVIAPCGTDYQVVAFADSNGNRRREPGEPIDLVTKISVEPMANEEVTRPVSLSLRLDHTIPANLPLEVPGDITREQTNLISLGEVVDLNDPRFAAETGKTGLWEPYKFIKTYGAGIFFLEAYDPTRIPVLFIYGSGGSPQDWRYIIEHIDRSRFQPWFFHYATGIRLERWSSGLNSLVKRLHARLGFGRLFVVAHSMGGLVARDFILRNTLDDHEIYITRFITISTPWAGHKAAARGVKRSPLVVPSWNDIEPQSAFLDSLFQRKLPPAVTYYLIYGTKRGLWQRLLRLKLGENDGVVGVDSELAPPAKEEAHETFLLNYEHTAILSAPQTLEKLQEYLTK